MIRMISMSHVSPWNDHNTTGLLCPVRWHRNRGKVGHYPNICYTISLHRFTFLCLLLVNAEADNWYDLLYEKSQWTFCFPIWERDPLSIKDILLPCNQDLPNVDYHISSMLSASTTPLLVLEPLIYMLKTCLIVL